MDRTESPKTIAPRDIPSVPFAIVAGCILAGAAYAYAVGDDVDWDWRNYHAYDVWAAINHRIDIDVQPAGFQTYFNPLIYYPTYALIGNSSHTTGSMGWPIRFTGLPATTAPLNLRFAMPALRWRSFSLLRQSAPA